MKIIRYIINFFPKLIKKYKNKQKIKKLRKMDPFIYD